MGDRDDMWRELERRGAVYARVIFSVQEGQARVDAVILYDGYAPPWHHELGELEPDSDLGVALWIAGGGRDIERGDVFSGDGEMGFNGGRARSEHGMERPLAAANTRAGVRRVGRAAGR